MAIITQLFNPSRTYPNMLDAHPPLQIDGDFGAHSPSPRCCCQVKPAKLSYSPPSPVRGQTETSKGCALAAVLKLIPPSLGGKLTKVKNKSVGGPKATVRYGNRTTEVKWKSGDTVQLNSELQPAA